MSESVEPLVSRTILLIEERQGAQHWLAEKDGLAAQAPRWPTEFFRNDAAAFDEHLRERGAFSRHYTSEQLLAEPRTRIVAYWSKEDGVRLAGDPMEDDVMTSASVRYLGPDGMLWSRDYFRSCLVALVNDVELEMHNAVAIALLEAPDEYLDGINIETLSLLLSSPFAPVRSAAMRIAPRIHGLNLKHGGLSR